MRKFICTIVAFAALATSALQTNAAQAQAVANVVQDQIAVGNADKIVAAVRGVLPTKTRTLIIKDAVYSNEVINTDDGSAAHLVFRDKTILSIGANSSVTLDKFVFDPAGKNSRVALSLTKGVMRFVTGNLSKDRYSIKTPTATVGIRGTIVRVRVNKDKSTFTSVFKGAATVRSGGRTRRVRAGFSTTARQGRAPSQPKRTPPTPPEVKAMQASLGAKEDLVTDAQADAGVKLGATPAGELVLDKILTVKNPAELLAVVEAALKTDPKLAVLIAASAAFEIPGAAARVAASIAAKSPELAAKIAVAAAKVAPKVAAEIAASVAVAAPKSAAAVAAAVAKDNPKEAGSIAAAIIKSTGAKASDVIDAVAKSTGQSAESVKTASDAAKVDKIVDNATGKTDEAAKSKEDADTALATKLGEIEPAAGDPGETTDPKDKPKDEPKDKPKDGPKDGPKDKPKGGPKDKPKDGPKDKPNGPKKEPVFRLPDIEPSAGKPEKPKKPKEPKPENPRNNASDS